MTPEEGGSPAPKTSDKDAPSNPRLVGLRVLLWAIIVTAVGIPCVAVSMMFMFWVLAAAGSVVGALVMVSIYALAPAVLAGLVAAVSTIRWSSRQRRIKAILLITGGTELAIVLLAALGVLGLFVIG